MQGDWFLFEEFTANVEVNTLKEFRILRVGEDGSAMSFNSIDELKES